MPTMAIGTEEEPGFCIPIPPSLGPELLSVSESGEEMTEE
jgi:hypothetical protein